VRAVQFWIYTPAFPFVLLPAPLVQLLWAEKCFSQQPLPKSSSLPTPTAVYLFSFAFAVLSIAGGADVDAGPQQLCE
jgi:hypothetical protein